MIETLKKLCALDGVSGWEDNVRAFIKDHGEKCDCSVETDTMGNLIVFKRGKRNLGKTVMLTANMDEAGVMVTHITEDGYIKFSCIGNIDRRVLIGKEIYLGENRVYGVIGNKAIHLVTADERGKIPKTEDMYIDIGAVSDKDAKELVSVGDMGSFDNRVVEYGNSMLKAKALSGRAGCAVLMKLMESQPDVDCLFVFTVQKELGSRGIMGAAFAVKPDIALILDGVASGDVPSVSAGKKVCSPGGGVVIPFMDKGTIYDKKLYALLCSTADECGIKRQSKSTVSGSSDAAGVQCSRGGVRTASIGVAVRNINSPASTVDIDDVKAMYATASAFIQKIGDNI